MFKKNLLACFHAAKKGFESQVNPHRDVLENLRMYLFEFRMRLLPLSKVRNLVVHRERLLLRLIDRRALHHQAVVDITADGTSRTKRGFLRSGRKETVLYADHTHAYMLP